MRNWKMSAKVRALFYNYFWLTLLIYGFVIGSFGKVSKIRRKSDGRTLVWKELNYGRMNEKEKQ